MTIFVKGSMKTLHTIQEKFNIFLRFLKSKPIHWILLPLLVAGALLKNILLQMFISGNNSFKPQFTVDASLLFTGLFFSLITTLLLLCPTLLFKKSKAKLIYGMTVSILMTVLLLVDCYYYRSFSAIPSVSILSTLTGKSAGSGKTAIGDSLFGLISPYDLLFFADYAALLLYALFHKLHKSTETIKEHIKRQKQQIAFFFDRTLRYRLIRFASFTALCLTALLFLPALHALGAAEDAYYSVYDSAYSHNTVFYFTPIGYHIANIVDTVEKQVESAHPDDEEDDEDLRQKELIELFLSQKEQLPDNEYAGIFKDKNVILVQVESLENAVIGQSIGGVPITPTLNRLVGQSGSSLYFPNIYDQVRAGNSSDCDLMVNTSFLPTGDVFFRTYNQKLQPSLPLILRNRGYGTYYYNGSGSTSVWSYDTVYQNVFGYVTDENDADCNFHMIDAPSNKDKVYHYASDEYTFNYVLQDLEKQQGKEEHFFSQIILCSSHTPFRYDNLSNEENRNLIPKEYNLPVPTQKDLAESKTFHYLNALHYVDAQLGLFLEKAEKAGLLEDTVVLIYGDHLGIHKYAPNEAESIAWEYEEYAFLSGEDYHTVPLIIHDPSGNTKSETFTLPGGQSDIMPTLLYLLGVDKEEYPFAMGKVLVNTKRNYTLIANGTVIGTIPNEEAKKTALLMYKISDALIERDHFGDLVKDLRQQAAKRSTEALPFDQESDE